MRSPSNTNARPAEFAIGALSKRTGVNIETIRYYERVGLMPKAARSTGGRRLYAHSDVRRLGFIRRACELGLPLDDARALLELGTDGVGRSFGESHLARSLAIGCRKR